MRKAGSVRCSECGKSACGYTICKECLQKQRRKAAAASKAPKRKRDGVPVDPETVLCKPDSPQQLEHQEEIAILLRSPIGSMVAEIFDALQDPLAISKKGKPIISQVSRITGFNNYQVRDILAACRQILQPEPVSLAAESEEEDTPIDREPLQLPGSHSIEQDDCP